MKQYLKNKKIFFLTPGLIRETPVNRKANRVRQKKAALDILE